MQRAAEATGRPGPGGAGAGRGGAEHGAIAQVARAVVSGAAVVDLTVLSQWSGRQLRTELRTNRRHSRFLRTSAGRGPARREWDQLALATERPDEYVTLSHAEFNRDAAKASILDFCIDIGAEPTPPQPHDDRDRVIASITAFTELRIRQRLDQTLTIPPLPEATRRILELKSDPDFDLRDLTVVEADQVYRRASSVGRTRLLRSARTGDVDLERPARHGSASDAEHGVGDCVQQDLKVPSTCAACRRIGCGRVHRDDGNAPRWSTLAPLPGYSISRLLANFGTLVIGRLFPPFTRRSVASRKRTGTCRTYVDQRARRTA